ncbi:MAG: hypothetical protein JWQ98_1095 [Chlorobi bacterium]|nr:hypothetical protein [Chlorobiota bacterium]
MRDPLHTIFLAVVLFTVGIVSAGCDNTVDKPIVQFPAPAADFPNAVGSRWTYSVYYLPKKQYDTLTVTIYGDTMLADGRRASIWRYAWSSDADTEYVTNRGDTVKGYFNDSAGYELADEYVYPLVPGKRWADGIPGDTSLVVNTGTYSVPAGNFSQAVRIDRQFPKQRDALWLSTWVAPSVGIIAWKKYHFDFGPFEQVGSEEYQLLRYTPAP